MREKENRMRARNTRESSRGNSERSRDGRRVAARAPIASSEEAIPGHQRRISNAKQVAQKSE